MTDLLCRKLVQCTIKYRQFTLRIWPSTLTFDLDCRFYIWLLLRIPIYTYILNFSLLRQILSDIAIFDDAFRRGSTYRPVERKPEVVAQIWYQPFRRGSPTGHFGFYLVSLRQILRILRAREISPIYVTYLTFDLDLWPWPEMSLSNIDQGPI